MKPVFPTAYSTLSADALASFISTNYSLGPVQCRFLARGVGDTYLVDTAGERFILRIYRSSHRGLAVIQAEATLLTALKNAGVAVSYPIADSNNELIQSFEAAEGTRYGMLFSYAEGQVINAPNPAQLRSLGHEMARFHNVSSAISLEGNDRVFDARTTLFEPLEKIKDCFANDPDGYAWLRQAARQVEETLRGMDITQFSSGYCHFDFLPKNFHFNDDKITFFDFDFFGYGWLVNDIMVFWQHLCLDVFFNRITQEDADKSYAIFLEAYRELRPLQEEELKAVPYLSLGFWLFYMGFHTTHDQFYPFIFEPAALKVRTGVIRQLMDRYWNKP
jgi:Ser/Thr protein kinase RdoA (MazF antagonist)